MAVEVGSGAVLGAFHHDGGPDDRLAVVVSDDGTLYVSLCQHGCQSCQPQREGEQKSFVRVELYQ